MILKDLVSYEKIGEQRKKLEQQGEEPTELIKRRVS